MCFKSQKENHTTMDNQYFDISVLSIETIKLDRDVHSQKEYCKNLENVFKSLDAELSVIHRTNLTTSTSIQDAIKRQNFLEKYMVSTNNSAKLVDDLLCDLKKQMQLEKIQTFEESQHLNTIICRYEVAWDNYQVINLAFNCMCIQAHYMTFPLAQEEKDLRVSVQLDSIRLRNCKVGLADMRRKLRVIEKIKDKQNQLHMIQIASQLRRKSMCLKEKVDLLNTVSELRKNVAALRQEKLMLQKQEQNSNLSNYILNSVVTSANVNGEELSQTSGSLSLPLLPTLQQLKESSLCFQTRLISGLELPRPLSSFLPVLKIPEYNSPPRKIPRYSSPSIRNFLYPSTPSLLHKSVSVEQDQQPQGLVDIENAVEPSPADNDGASEAARESNLNIQSIAESNSQVQLTTDGPAEQEDDAAEDNTNADMPPAVTQRTDESLDDDLMNETARLAYIHQLKKSPAMNYSMRSGRAECEYSEMSPSDETTSRYFVQSAQFTQNSDGEQYMNMEEGGEVGGEVRTIDSSPNQSMESCGMSPSENSVDNILAQFASPPSPGTTALSPTVPPRLDNELYLNNAFSSAHQGAGDAAGFCFNFGSAPSQNPITSLFGGGEQEAPKKSSEAFNFSFNNKTKSTSFFKLF